MANVSVEEAQANLPLLIHSLKPGDQLVITENNQPVARLVGEPVEPKSGLRAPPGLDKGFITVISDDEEHLRDFEE